MENTQQNSNESEHPEQKGENSANNVDNSVDNATSPQNQELEDTSKLPKKEESSIEDSPELKTEQEKIQDEISESEHGEMSEQEEADEHNLEEEQDFSSFSKEELLAFVKNAAAKPQGKNIGRKVQQAKSEFNRLVREQNDELKENWTEEGNEEVDFIPEVDPLVQDFNAAFKEFKKSRQAYINQLNQEKEGNLERKKNVLERLKQLTESDETGESFEEFKKLQQEWRSIKQVPANDSENLWNNYHFYVDKFYEHRSLYSEFKELDRKRNLAAKEDVVNKIEALIQSEDLNEALRQLKQLQEEWRHLGPVPREQVESVIHRYKAAVLKLYELKEKQSEELQQRRELNYQAKLEILEKIEELASFETNKVQDWIDKNKELGEWIEKWREIGSVPVNQTQNLKDRFTGAIRNFNKNKNDFFRNRKKDKVDNLKKKNALCERAEEIMNEENPAQFRKEVIKLQEEWKKAGPVPQKYSDKIWKRFQAACDAIFSKINHDGKQRATGERENLEKKNAIILKIDALSAAETIEDPQTKIREIQAEWNSIGFVPFKEKDGIRKRYSESLNNLLRKTRSSMPAGSDMDEINYEQMAQEPGGSRRLDQEFQKHNRDLKRIENEISTLENNMEFLSRSKTADKLKDNIEKQISRLRERMDELQGKIKTIRQYKS
jgi:hypothetical protein